MGGKGWVGGWGGGVGGWEGGVGGLGVGGRERRMGGELLTAARPWSKQASKQAHPPAHPKRAPSSMVPTGLPSPSTMTKGGSHWSDTMSSPVPCATGVPGRGGGGWVGGGWSEWWAAAGSARARGHALEPANPGGTPSAPAAP